MTEVIEKLLETKENPRDLFNLQKVVGRGAFGKIYMGCKKGKESEILAIKVLHYDPGNEENAKKLIDEIEFMKLTSSCSQMVHYVGTYLEHKKKGNFYIWVSMEYCDCGSLASYIKSIGKPFEEAYVSSICKQVLEALIFLSKHRIAHRDLKSANLLWNRQGIIKVADLGEATTINEKKWEEEGSNIAGTPYFMAPEITAAEPYTEKVDIWSLGVTLIELAELKNPFFLSPPFLVISQVATGLITPSLKSPENFSSEFLDILKQCLTYDQEKRPTAQQLSVHSFFSKKNDEGLASLALQYALSQDPKSKEVISDKITVDKKMATHLVMIKDSETGENMKEFLQNLDNWKERNKVILLELSQQSKLGKIGVTKGTSSTSLFSKKSTQELDKRLQQFSIVKKLVHIASKLSSQAFGLIVASRTVEGVFHEKCFLGKECVDWIYENLQLQKRDEAIQLANHLVEAGLIVLVTPKRNDIDSELSAFRFDSSKIAEWSRGYIQATPRLESLHSARNLFSDEEVATQNKMEELTERDWQLIFSGATPLTYQKDQVIVQQDTDNLCLYRISKGSVRVEKVEDGKTNSFGTMSVGQMFGEMSVLTGSKTSANIIANESTEINSADLNFMSRLFKTEPGIQRRFYKNAAIKLAKRLKEVGSDKSNQKIENRPSQTAIIDSRDKNYVGLFNLPKTEVLIQDYSCFIKGLVKEPARLYVSQRFVCIYAKIFGKPTKTVLELRDILSIEVTNKKALKIKTKKKKVSLHGFKDVAGTQTLLKSLIDSQLNRTSSQTLRRMNSAETEEEGEILSDFDWIILLREAQSKSFKKNEVIVNEGEFAARIFQIGSGKCRVEVQKKVVGHMGEGEVFGEISFLEGGKTSASVIADEEGTDVFIIEGARLRVLFFRQPALAGRFYQYLSAILSIRLKEREKRK